MRVLCGDVDATILPMACNDTVVVMIGADTTRSYPRITAVGLLDESHVWNVTSENIAVDVLPPDHKHTSLWVFNFGLVLMHTARTAPGVAPGSGTARRNEEPNSD